MLRSIRIASATDRQNIWFNGEITMIYRFNIPIPDFPRINYMLGVDLG